MNHSLHHSPRPNNGADGLILPPDQYRQLTVARSAAQMRAYLAAGLGAPSADGAEPPICHLLDMKYAPNEQCTLLYQWGDQLWIGLLPWAAAPAQNASEATHAYHLAPLNLWLYPFPYDPALPALPTVLDSRALTEILRTCLPVDQWGGMALVRAHATPLRYRPGKRCTVQIDLLLRQPNRSALVRQRLYGKLYHDADKAAAVYDEMNLLTTAAAGRALTLATAVAFVPTLNLVLQAPVAGQPLDLLLRYATGDSITAAAAVTRAAQALATLHNLAVITERRRPGSNDVSKLSRRVAKVATVAPSLGEAMIALAQQLAQVAVHLPAWGATSAIGHGDCKPSQFLLNTTQTALLDFDHCGMADPAADVALFLATLRQGRVQQQTTARRQRTTDGCGDDTLNTAFYRAYCAATDVSPHFAQRVAWYEALALLRKAWRSFARSPWSPLPRLLVAEGDAALHG